MKTRLQAGELEDREVEVTIAGKAMAPVSILGAGNLEQMEMDLQGMFEKILPKQSQTRRMTVREARPILLATPFGRLGADGPSRTPGAPHRGKLHLVRRGRAARRDQRSR